MSAGGNSSENKSSNESGMTQGVWGPQQGVFKDLFGAVSGLMGGTGALGDRTQGAADGLTNAFTDAFGSVAALGDPTAQIQAQTDSLSAGLGKMFQEEINPALTSNAIAAGGSLGSGRQGVAQGVATGQIADAFTQGYGDIVANANNTALQANSMLGGLQDNIFQNTNAGQYAQADFLSQLGGILGGPTVLSQSYGKGKGSGSSGGFSFGLF